MARCALSGTARSLRASSREHRRRRGRSHARRLPVRRGGPRPPHAGRILRSVGRVHRSRPRTLRRPSCDDGNADLHRLRRSRLAGVPPARRGRSGVCRDRRQGALLRGRQDPTQRVRLGRGRVRRVRLQPALSSGMGEGEPCGRGGLARPIRRVDGSIPRAKSPRPARRSPKPCGCVTALGSFPRVQVAPPTGRESPRQLRSCS